jgi:hypothetical protein
LDARFQLSADGHLLGIVTPEITAGTRSVNDAAQRNLHCVGRLLAGGWQFDGGLVLVALAVHTRELDGGNVLGVFLDIQQLARQASSFHLQFRMLWLSFGGPFTKFDGALSGWLLR